ncbi:hypothetical protein [Leifsonia sp. RAF41]|uniref:hypothetical protein n=1 Tax=Leifsonia sp. RAF41 TaxID=3233056 RepID=UPI003F975AA1
MPTHSAARDNLDAERLARLHNRLDQLHDLRLRERQIQEDIDALAVALRADGASWAQIGVAVGVSPQAAHQRWSPEGKKKHNERQQQRHTLARDGSKHDIRSTTKES